MNIDSNIQIMVTENKFFSDVREKLPQEQKNWSFSDHLLNCIQENHFDWSPNSALYWLGKQTTHITQKVFEMLPIDQYIALFKCCSCFKIAILFTNNTDEKEIIVAATSLVRTAYFQDIIQSRSNKEPKICIEMREMPGADTYFKLIAADCGIYSRDIEGEKYSIKELIDSYCVADYMMDENLKDAICNYLQGTYFDEIHEIVSSKCGPLFAPILRENKVYSSGIIKAYLDFCNRPSVKQLQDIIQIIAESGKLSGDFASYGQKILEKYGARCTKLFLNLNSTENIDTALSTIRKSCPLLQILTLQIPTMPTQAPKFFFTNHMKRLTINQRTIYSENILDRVYTRTSESNKYRLIATPNTFRPREHIAEAIKNDSYEYFYLTDNQRKKFKAPSHSDLLKDREFMIHLSVNNFNPRQQTFVFADESLKRDVSFIVDILLESHLKGRIDGIARQIGALIQDDGELLRAIFEELHDYQCFIALSHATKESRAMILIKNDISFFKRQLLKYGFVALIAASDSVFDELSLVALDNIRYRSEWHLITEKLLEIQEKGLIQEKKSFIEALFRKYSVEALLKEEISMESYKKNKIRDLAKMALTDEEVRTIWA